MSFYLMHRGWMDNPVFSEEKFTDKLAWIWLVQEASFEPHKVRYGYQMVEVRRGQIPTSYRRLKDKWGWSQDRIRRFLGLLEGEGMITTETSTGFLVITICNYDKYQRPLTKSGTQPGTVTGTEVGTQPGTNKIKGNEFNEYNEPNENNLNSPLPPQESGVLKNLEEGVKDLKRYDVNLLLTEEARNLARKLAPKLDVYYLIGVYNDGIRKGQRLPPDYPCSAFPAWCENYQAACNS